MFVHRYDNVVCMTCSLDKFVHTLEKVESLSLEVYKSERLLFLQNLVNMITMDSQLDLTSTACWDKVSKGHMKQFVLCTIKPLVTIVTSLVRQITVTVTESILMGATRHERFHSHSCMCRDSAIQLDRL